MTELSEASGDRRAGRPAADHGDVGRAGPAVDAHGNPSAANVTPARVSRA